MTAYYLHQFQVLVRLRARLPAEGAEGLRVEFETAVGSVCEQGVHSPRLANSHGLSFAVSSPSGKLRNCASLPRFAVFFSICRNAILGRKVPVDGASRYDSMCFCISKTSWVAFAYSSRFFG